jgi:hypothetical protein
MTLHAERFRELYEASHNNTVRDKCAFNKDFLQWVDNGNTEELAKYMVRSYQQMCSGPLNNALRRQDRRITLAYSLRAQILDLVLDSLPAFTESVVWRNDSPEEEIRLWASRNVGEVLLIPSFWSTYHNPEKWTATSPTFKILTSAHSNARRIAEFTNFQVSEGEVLFKTNTKFKVLSVEECVTLAEVENEEATIIGFDGYFVSQEDADHSHPIQPSLND